MDVQLALLTRTTPPKDLRAGTPKTESAIICYLSVWSVIQNIVQWRSYAETNLVNTGVKNPVYKIFSVGAEAGRSRKTNKKNTPIAKQLERTRLTVQERDASWRRGLAKRGIARLLRDRDWRDNETAEVEGRASGKKIMWGTSAKMSAGVSEGSDADEVGVYVDTDEAALSRRERVDAAVESVEVCRMGRGRSGSTDWVHSRRCPPGNYRRWSLSEDALSRRERVDCSQE
ncbi:hypothetical protein BV22DRAFT_1122821 [Leucogyrophana mollusca]|uniref:Uncharacterized protein n=1 Tax=Leucogyrophana mollusca TaxID=85980 RepID=A0ACB8B458_9AGAM|nr:hypothetical protein BV22DRAFT_1122821 [Leucogyrophana mollusca]